MSIESKVFEKLFTGDKVELASQKVELALTDDFNKLFNEAKDNKDKSKSNLDNIIKVKDSLILLIDKGYEIDKKTNDIEKRAINLYDKLRIQAKDLGIDFKITDAGRINEMIIKELLLTTDMTLIKSVIKTVLSR